jgi:molecular chaperone GrpE
MSDSRDADPPAEGTPPPDAPAPAPAEPVEEWESRFKYLYADFENYRRRTERERERISRESRGAMLRELLPILEAFRSAREAADRLAEGEPLRRGFDLLEREWSTFLKHEGVEAVATVGATFRAEEAEAVGEAPAPDGAGPGTVVEVVQQGYRYFGGVLRPAKVVVARAAAPAAPSPDESNRPGEGA